MAQRTGLIDPFFTGVPQMLLYLAGARNGFAEPRDREPNSGLSRPQPAAETASLPFEPAKMPANCGLFGRDQERPVGIELRGGAERTQTTCQAFSAHQD